MKAPVGIELFAGCGGLSTGFLDAGLHVASGFEIDKRAIEAFEYNHAYRGCRGYVQNLCGIDPKQLLQTSGLRKVDFIIGGPPCQPFSIAGKQGASRDERASLLDDYARVINELCPKAFLFENVPNLAAIEDGAIFQELCRKLAMAGYKLSHAVVHAADFGVPQMRRRLILMGVRGRKAIEFPVATHNVEIRQHVSSREAIGDLPDAGEYEDCGVFNHEPTMHSVGMVQRIQNLMPGTRERGSFHDRLHPDRPSYTLRAGSGNFSPLRPIHYKFNRVITVRESARLQGFSDSFIWPDTIPRLQQYRQVGNAVPPPLAVAFARVMAVHCDWELQPAKFYGDPTSRASPITMSSNEKLAKRRSLIRGASQGSQKSASC